MASHKGGPVDAGIAALFCLGVVAPQFSGIGGGHFMTYYDKYVHLTWGTKKGI